MIRINQPDNGFIQYIRLTLYMIGHTVKNELVLQQIARLEDISITKKEYNEYLNENLEKAGYTAESFKEERGMTIEEYAEENNLFTSCLYEKVMEKVMEYGVGK